ncbi:MAG: oligosaccharide repeat unit polymerase [Halobacteriovoraceae bacterium]|nr:oligosaccharide repeat unit polymerase [Halobacteriovoraceae bacterium]
MQESYEFYLWLSSLIIVIKLLIHFKDPMNILIIFYYFFTFGTVINYHLGAPIYFGIVQEYIPMACKIFFIGILTMCSLSFIFKNLNYKEKNLTIKHYDVTSLKPLLILLIVFSLYQIVLLLLTGDSLSKVERVAFVGPSLHYPYLLIQNFLIAYYLILDKKKLTFKFFTLNLALYLCYCLMTGERDFVFLFTSILIHNLLLFKQSRKKIILYSFFMIWMLIGAVGVFLLRDASQGSESIIEALLNQGSILFINTNVIKYLELNISSFNGFTYLNSFINLIPSWIYHTDFNTVSWFKEMYAPASNSGYGFALDAEGFMNFGLAGVFGTFFFITVIQRIIYNNIDRHPMMLYFSTFYLSFSMYSLRNDSLAFFKGNLYAIIFYVVIHLSSRFYRILTSQAQGKNFFESTSSR